MNRADILNTARDCVTRDRAATHGDAEDNFAWIAGHWNWWLQDKLMPGASLTPYDVAQMMVGFKQARAKGNPAHMDSHVDAAGYVAIGGEIALRATERAATAPQDASPAHGTRQPVPGVYGAWARNSYTDLHDTLIGPADDAQDGDGLFPSAWTPEADDPDTNEKG